MKKISQVLIESQHTRKQTTGSYFGYAIKVDEIKEYCAMGALFCESHLLEEVTVDNYTKIQAKTEAAVIEYFLGKNKNYFEESVVCKLCKELGDGYEKRHPYRPVSIAAYIIHMNDSHKATFEKIGKVLEKMGY